MRWVMKANILDMEQVSVYAANKEYMNLAKIWYIWEVL